MFAACSEIIWLQRLLSELGIEMKVSITLYGDNTSAIRIATNPVHHENTKHIDVDCHYIRELVEDQSISLKYISSNDQLADYLQRLYQEVDTNICYPNSCFVIHNISLREGVDYTLFIDTKSGISPKSGISHYG